MRSLLDQVQDLPERRRKQHLLISFSIFIHMASRDVVLTWLVNWALARGKALGLGVVAIFGRKRVGFGWVSRVVLVGFYLCVDLTTGDHWSMLFCEKEEEVTKVV